MALNVTNFVHKGALLHEDVGQFADLLTGVMSDQPVTISNSLTATGAVAGGTGTAKTTIGASPSTGAWLNGSNFGGIIIGSGPNPYWSWGPTNFNPWNNNAEDIGTSSQRVRTLYVGTSIIGPGAVPVGGASGQVLTKTSAADYAVGWTTPSGGALSWPLLAPDGTAAAPSYSFANATGTGMYLSSGVLTVSAASTVNVQAAATFNIQFWIGGTTRWRFDANGMLTAATDNAYDIGALGATRPRNVYVAGSVIVTGGSATNLTLGSASGSYVLAGNTGSLVFGVASNPRWYIDATTFALGASSDGNYDIGFSGGPGRPRDLFLGRNAFINGVAGIGTAPVAYSGLIFQPIMSGPNQFALYAPLTFSTSGTGNTFVFYTLPTYAASTRTVAAGASFYADAPTIGSGVTVTSMFGYYAANQGKTGVTNAYGVYIAAQSGATTANMGLRNEGTTRLTGRVGINNDPWVDNTRYVAISGVVSIFNGTMSLDNGMGVGPSPATMLNVGGNLTGAPTQNGMYFRVNGDATATAQIVGVAVQVGTANGSYTVPVVSGFYVDGPILGTGTSVTTVRGINVVNQGGAGRTNAYGIYLQATSGASSANYSLYNLGNSFFGQQIYIGSLNETIRNPVSNMAGVSIESADGYASLQGRGGALVAYNAYWDGTNWQRFNTANSAAHINLGSVLSIYSAVAGSNPIASWVSMLQLDATGNASFGGKVQSLGFWTGSSFGAGWPVPGDINISRGGSPATGYIFLADTSHYVGFDGLYYRLAAGPGLSPLLVEGNMLYLYSDMTRRLYAAGPTLSYGCGPGGNHSFEFTAGGAAACVGASFTPTSARKLKRDIQILTDPLATVLDPRVHGVSYVERASGEARVGFVADDWLGVLPEVVSLDDVGDVVALDYDRISAVTFEALKRFAIDTDARLKAVEAICLAS